MLQGPNTDRDTLKRLRRTLEEGKVFYGEAINYRKDGVEFCNEWHIEPVRDRSDNIIYYMAIQRDITQKKQAAQAIEQKNAALREVLEQVQIEKKRIQDDVVHNVNKALIPMIKKIRLRGSKTDKQYLDALEKNFKDIISGFGARTNEVFAKLSARELEIANLIKNGLSNKEISEMLNLSTKTVQTHRSHIRSKLRIVNKKVNLSSYIRIS